MDRMTPAPVRAPTRQSQFGVRLVEVGGGAFLAPVEGLVEEGGVFLASVEGSVEADGLMAVVSHGSVITS